MVGSMSLACISRLVVAGPYVKVHIDGNGHKWHLNITRLVSDVLGWLDLLIHPRQREGVRVLEILCRTYVLIT